MKALLRGFAPSAWKTGLVGLASGAIVMVACSSSDSTTTTNTTTSTAAAVSGAADTHCGGRVVTISEAACTAAPAEEPDAGGGGTVSEYGATLFNAEGDDDDCKYRISWTSTAVTQNADVSFSVVVTKKSDGSPVTGAKADAEVFLDETHPAPNSGSKSVETAPGKYTIGPIRFDKAGQWTTRFHLFDDCNDSEESPHGHGAFFVKVP